MIMLVFCVAAVLLGAIEAGTHADLTRLHERLMANYSKDLRPTFNLSQPTIVYVGFQLMSLKEFDEKLSKFAIVGMFIIAWNDFRMQWNPNEFGGINHTFLPQNSVWKPNFVLMNPFDKISDPGMDSLVIRVDYYGGLAWAPPDVYTSTCQADVTYYPFDQQKCSLYFNTYMYTTSDVRIQLQSSKVDVNYYLPDSLWELINATCNIITELNSQSLVLDLVLTRRPMFQVINTIVPFCVLGLLNIMVFLLPAESGERVGFSVTVLLAIAVFMTIVADTLPGTSEPSFPRLCYLLTAELCINMFVTITAILSLRLHHASPNETIPYWLKGIICKCICFKSRNEISDVRMVKNTKAEQIACVENVDSNTQVTNNTLVEGEQGYALSSDTTTRSVSQPQDNRSQICASWQTVAQYLDIFLFTLFSIIFTSNKIIAYHIFS
ncbi:acetylcholine receptor subunit beta-like [Argopecten irradians]|uniref:acetylcholine receptor subunit beta-like n=1 Tax=Argopecten irradians TaxID=31199 RepID=UPI0037196F48